jgi:hypothetical protein
MNFTDEQSGEIVFTLMNLLVVLVGFERILHNGGIILMIWFSLGCPGKQD